MYWLLGILNLNLLIGVNRFISSHFRPVFLGLFKAEQKQQVIHVNVFQVKKEEEEEEDAEPGQLLSWLHSVLSHRQV